MATGALVSVDEYLSTVYAPDREYIDGEVLERNVGESGHSGIQMIVAALLYGQRHERGIHIFPELRVQVAARRFRVPDITVTTHRIEGPILRTPPLLCIEILSPKDRASRIEKTIDDYLAFGVQYVWLIDPATKRGWSYTREGERHAAATLTTSNPDLALSLNEVFEALSEDVEP